MGYFIGCVLISGGLKGWVIGWIKYFWGRVIIQDQLCGLCIGDG